MPEFSCSVGLCTSTSAKIKQNGKNVIFHWFPKALAKTWLGKCLERRIIVKWTRKCSKHFVDEDYEDCIKARIMGTHPKTLKDSCAIFIGTPIKKKITKQLLHQERFELKRGSSYRGWIEV